MVYHKKRKLGKGVAIVGVGMSQFGVRTGMNSRELFVEAFNDMIKKLILGREQFEKRVLAPPNNGATEA